MLKGVTYLVSLNCIYRLVDASGKYATSGYSIICQFGASTGAWIQESYKSTNKQSPVVCGASIRTAKTRRADWS